MGLGENKIVEIFLRPMDMVHIDISKCKNHFYGWWISPLIAVLPMSTVASSSAAVTKVSRTRLSPSRSRSERPSTSVRLVYGQGSLR